MAGSRSLTIGRERTAAGKCAWPPREIGYGPRFGRTRDSLKRIGHTHTERGVPSALYIRVAAAFPSAAIRSVCRFGFRHMHTARKIPAIGRMEPCA